MSIDYQKLNEEIENLKKLNGLDLQEELKKELKNQSDRGVAIVCASILDEQLKEVLSAFFIESDKGRKELFNTGEPLSTFSSKIKMSYYLGLITENEYRNIEIIRKIRNDFAHRITGISFEDQSIKSRCGNLSIPKEQYFPNEFGDIPLPNEDGSLPKIDLEPFSKDTPPRDRFVEVFTYLSLNFYERSSETKKIQRKEFKLETTRADFLKNLAETYIDNQERINALKEAKNKIRREAGEAEVIEDKSELQKVLDDAVQLYLYMAEVLENSYKD